MLFYMDKENPRLKNLIKELKKKGNEEEASIWLEIAERLESPRQEHSEVNVGEIDRYVDEDEDALVPGKVLGGGRIDKRNVVAFDFSSSAKKKIEENGGNAFLLENYMEKNPEGSKTRVIR